MSSGEVLQFLAAHYPAETTRNEIDDALPDGGLYVDELIARGLAYSTATFWQHGQLDTLRERVGLTRAGRDECVDLYGSTLAVDLERARDAWREVGRSVLRAITPKGRA